MAEAADSSRDTNPRGASLNGSLPARFIGSEIYRRSTYGAQHPLAIPRVSTVIDLCRALGWLPEDAYLDSPQATPDALARFHDPDYVAALREVETTQTVSTEQRERFNLGRNGNPVFPEIFRRPATESKRSKPWSSRPRIASTGSLKKQKPLAPPGLPWWVPPAG